MSRDLREFIPIEEGKVRMYVCGPTVYNYIHVGNARSTVAFDTIRRYFEYCGYTVNYISNFTDVDDKIINRAKEEGITPQEVADKYIRGLPWGRYRLLAWNLQLATLVWSSLWMKSFVLSLTWSKKTMPMRAKAMSISVWKNQTTMLKLANKNSRRLGARCFQVGQMKKERKENPVDFALWKVCQNQVRFLGTALGDLVVLVGTSSVRSCQLGFWGILLISTVVEPTLSFHNHTNEIAQSEAQNWQDLC